MYKKNLSNFLTKIKLKKKSQIGIESTTYASAVDRLGEEIRDGVYKVMMCVIYHRPRDGSFKILNRY